MTNPPAPTTEGSSGKNDSLFAFVSAPVFPVPYLFFSCYHGIVEHLACSFFDSRYILSHESD